MAEVERSEDEPMDDRLSQLCAVAIAALEASPLYREDDQMVIFLDDDEAGGLVLHGYDDDTDAVSAILGHLTAVFEANGMTLQVISMGDEV